MAMDSIMQLVVTIEQSPDPELQGTRWRCGEEGGTLGRADSCDLVLPDERRFTSSVHAVIETEDGDFQIVDRSTNGTFHNAAGKLIGKGRSAVLESGDRIYIGDYVMRVEIESDAAPTGATVAPECDDFDQGSTGIPPSAEDTPGEEWDAGEFSLPWEGGDSESERDQKASDSDDDDDSGFSQSPEREYFSAPSTGKKPAELIPDDWDSFLTGFHESPGSKPAASDESGAGASRASDRQETSAKGQDAPMANAFDAEDAAESKPAGPPAPEPEPEPESEPEPERGPGPGPGPGTPADKDAGADVGRAPEAESSEPDPAADPGARTSTGEGRDSRTRTAGGSESIPGPPAQPQPFSKPESQAEVAPEPPDASQPRSEPARPRKAEEPPAEAGPGTPPASATDDKLSDMLRVVTEGLMALLQGRAEIKNEFRISQTRFVQTENNPLKFSPNADEAMTRILGASEGVGFLTGPKAYEDALNDLQAHQLALLSAAQRAVESVIEQFDPAQLESRLQRISPLSARTPGLKAAKCWNLYTMHYEDVAGKMRDDARQMFLAEFAEAYEEACQQVVQARDKRR